MKILLTGRNGMLGWELERALAALGSVAAFDHAQLDLTRPDDLVAKIRELRPDVIVNAAAYTNVDKAEEEQQLAHAINAQAPGIMAEEAAKLGALIVHYSTDYVFDGEKEGPYTETDTPNPLNVYGKSKLEGERAVQAANPRHLIFRTSWVYAGRGKNFFLTMLKRLQNDEQLRVVDDQFGAPTWSRELADITRRALAHLRPEHAGLYNAAASGSTTWFSYAKAIAEFAAQQGMPVKARFVPISYRDYPTKTRRPGNSVFDLGKLENTFGKATAAWRPCLERCLAETVPTDRLSAATRQPSTERTNSDAR